MNKRGYIRTIEAVIAVIMVFGVIIFVNRVNISRSAGTPDVIDNQQKYIIEKFSTDTLLRTCIVTDAVGSPPVQDGIGYTGNCFNDPNFILDSTKIPDNAPSSAEYGDYSWTGGNFNCFDAFDKFMGSVMSGTFGYACEICTEPNSCAGDTLNVPATKSVYTEARFIAVEGSVVNQKVIRIYTWIKG